MSLEILIVGAVLVVKVRISSIIVAVRRWWRSVRLVVRVLRVLLALADLRPVGICVLPRLVEAVRDEDVVEDRPRVHGPQLEADRTNVVVRVHILHELLVRDLLRLPDALVRRGRCASHTNRPCSPGCRSSAAPTRHPRRHPSCRASSPPGRRSSCACPSPRAACPPGHRSSPRRPSRTAWNRSGHPESSPGTSSSREGFQSTCSSCPRKPRRCCPASPPACTSASTCSCHRIPA